MPRLDESPKPIQAVPDLPQPRRSRPRSAASMGCRSRSRSRAFHGVDQTRDAVRRVQGSPSIVQPARTDAKPTKQSQLNE
jgi:hypothetical protein